MPTPSFATVIRDVPERHRADEAIWESEQRFRLVANTAPVLMWMSDRDKLYTYFNKPWLDFTGRSVEQELGNGWAEGVHPDDLQRCLQTYSQFYDQREQFEMEYRLRRHDGEYRWLLDVGVPRFNQEGSFAGYIGICIDITERKCTEETLLRYASIVESSNEAIVGLDLKGTITYWNKGAERLFGYSAMEAIGNNVLLLSSDDARDDAIGVLKRALQGDLVDRYETVRKRKDGSLVEISLTVSRIIDAEGRSIGLSGIARDITERKRAEEAVSRHSAIVESSEDAIISKGLDGVITGWNAGAQRIFGYTEQEAVGKPITILVPPELRDEENKILEKLRTGERVEHFETIRLAKIGERVHVSLSISPIKDSSGRITGISKIARDITERKQKDEALSSMTRKLVEAQEQERARIARELHDDITQRLALLAIEIGQVQECCEKPFEVRTWTQKLLEHTKEIATDIQALSHELHSSKLEYLGLAGAIRNWCHEFAQRQGMEIAFKGSKLLNSPPPEISLCLFRVLQEALHNAAKYSGVKSLDVQLREESCGIELIVSDLGKGFDVAATMHDRGLGITSMRERVRLIGGTIRIDSKPLAGTNIHVRVPLGIAAMQPPN